MARWTQWTLLAVTLAAVIVAAVAIAALVGNHGGSGAAEQPSESAPRSASPPRTATAQPEEQGGESEALAETPGPDGGLACGRDRWPVKTLSDPRAKQVNLTPRAATVPELRQLKVTFVDPETKRLDMELQTVTVEARLVEMKIEPDRDIHLVISDPNDSSQTMIAELPDPACSGAVSSIARVQLVAARKAMLGACGVPADDQRWQRFPKGATAKLTGVVFVDEVHGQRGVAPNGIEIHPVLGVADLRCRG